MVAIVGGPGGGLLRTSAFQYGLPVLLGQAAQGRGGDNVYVNADNGKLIIESTDEILLGVGADEQLVRSYTSNTPTTYTPNCWMFSDQRRVFLESGTLNTAGSVVRRLAPDGSNVAYYWDAAYVNRYGTSGAYVGKEGEGGLDEITYSGGVWSWWDSATLDTETFDSNNNGRITSRKNVDDRGLTWAYDGQGRVSTITSSNGEVVTYDYVSATETQVHVTAGGQTRTRNRYTYDSMGRLITVVVDLSPVGNSVSDGYTFTTNYAYALNDDNTQSYRVGQITQSDGSIVQFGYTWNTNRYDVTSITQTAATGVTRTTTLSYDFTNNVTTVTDPLGQATQIYWDGGSRLITRVVAPPPVAGGSSQNTYFTYNSWGDVATITRPDGGVTTYWYDTHGNRIKEVDSLGDTVERTFETQRNLLLTETRYVTPAQGANPPANPLVTRYAYDSAGHLRFAVSADGRVTEYRYDSAGQPTSWGNATSEILYGETNLYTAAGTITESGLTTWSSGRFYGAMRTDTTFDSRGNVSSVKTFEQLYTNGQGDTSHPYTTVNYTYDQSGLLLSRQIVGSGMSAETFAYDGLWRITTSTDAGGTVNTAYTDASSTTVVTIPSIGLTKTSVYNLAGELISYSEAAAGLTTATTTYKYDAKGRLRMVTDPDGIRTYYLYDAVDRRIAEINDVGRVVEFAYNKQDQLVQTWRHRQTATSAQLASLIDANGNPANVSAASIRPQYDDNDSYTYSVYDTEGRLIETITEPQGYGAVVTYSYDGLGRLIQEYHYALELDRPVIAAFKAAPPTALTVPATYAPDDRIVRYFYDSDGNQIGRLDGEGYLTETVFDAAGRKVQTIAYANATSTTYRATGSFSQLKGSLTVDNANDIHNWWVWDGRGLLIGEIDGEGTLTRYIYDSRGYRTWKVYGQVISVSSLIAAQPTFSTLPAQPGSDGDIEGTSYAYDGYGRMLEASKHLSNGWSDERTFYTYDSVGRLVKTIQENRVTASMVADTRGFYTRYDAMGRVIGEIWGVGAASLDANCGANPTQAQLNTWYGTFGRVYTYDAASRLIARFDPNGVNAAGNRTIFYYDNAGRLRDSIDANGVVTETKYDLTFSAEIESIVHRTRIAAATLSGMTGGLLNATVNTTIAGVTDASVDQHHYTTYDLDGTVSDKLDSFYNRWRYGNNAFGELYSWLVPLSSGYIINKRYYDRRGLLTYEYQNIEGAANTPKPVTQYQYDAFGRVTRVYKADGSGLYKRYTYDRAGRVTNSIDELGKVTAYTYDNRGNVSSITDATSRTTSYVYDRFNHTTYTYQPGALLTQTFTNAFGQAVKVTDPLGRISTWVYDADGHLKIATDGAGASSSNTYDAAGRLFEETDASGVLTRYDYDAVSQVKNKWVDPNGLNLRTQYFYGVTPANALAPNKVFTIDPVGVQTEVRFDLEGRKSKVIVDPTGLQLTTDYTYNVQGQVTSETVMAGTATARMTSYAYDEIGRLKNEQNPIVNGASATPMTDYQYDLNGNVTAKKDGSGAITRYVYDDVGRLWFTVDGTGAVTKTDYDFAGRVASTRRYVGRVAPSTLTSWTWTTTVTFSTLNAAIAPQSGDELTSYYYDAVGRLYCVIDPSNRRTEYVYDAAGQLIRKYEYPGSAVAPSDPATRITRYVYDAAGREAFCIDAMGFVTSYKYDGAGRKTKEVRFKNAYTATDDPSFTAMGNWATANAHADDRITRTFYDAAGRARYVVDAESYLTQLVYDADSRVTKQVRYDKTYAIGDANTPAEMQNALNTLAGLVNTNMSWEQPRAAVTQYAYDQGGRVRATIGPEGAVTLFEYDGANQELKQVRVAKTYAADTTLGTGPAADMTTIFSWYNSGGGASSDDQVTRKVWDAGGNLRYSVDGLGYVTQYDYDGCKRLQTQTVYGDANYNPFTIGDYPNVSSMLALLATNPPPQLFAQTGYVYDAAGRVTVVSRSLDSQSAPAQTFNTYDAFGNLVKVEDPRHNIGYFYYDKLNRLTLQIDPEGYATESSYGIGNQATRVIRRAAKATNIGNVNVLPTLTSSVTDEFTDYTFDKLDRLTSVIDAEGHDLTGAIAAYAPQHTESYTLNAFGDRISVTNKLGGVTTNTFDKRGLLLSEVLPMQSVTMSGSVESNTVTNQYNYDSRGNRISMTEAAGLTNHRTTLFFYDKADRLKEKRGDTLDAYAQFNTATANRSTPSDTYKYDAMGNLTEQTDPDGGRVLYWYNRANQKIAQLSGQGAGTLKTFTYDANGNPATEKTYGDLVTMPGNPGGPAPTGGSSYREIRYTYDRNNRLVATKVTGLTVTRMDASSGLLVDTNQDINTSITYDATGNIIAQKDGRDAYTYFYYDKLGRQIAKVDALGYMTWWDRDQAGNVLTEKRYAKPVSGASTSSDPNVLKSSVDGVVWNLEDQRVTTFTYDRNGRRLTETRQGVVAHRIDDSSGLLQADPNNPKVSTTIYYAYNGLGLVTRKTEATGDYTDYTYDLMGRQTWAKSSAVYTSAGTWVQRAIETEYDGLGNITRVEDKALNGTAPRTTKYEYGDNGRLKSVYEANSSYDFRRDYVYTLGGKLVRESWTRYQVDGSSVTEGKGYAYDAAGRVTLQVSLDTPGGVWAQSDDQILFTYNAYGDLSGRGQNGYTQETFDYDSAGRMWRSTQGDGVVRIYAYDKAGNQTLEIASAGKDLTNKTTWTLDATLAYLGNNGNYENSTRTDIAATVRAYDVRGQQTETRAINRELVAGQPGVKITTLKSYNAWGEVASETDFNSNSDNGQTNSANVTNYYYNTQGKLILKQLPATTTVSETNVTQNIRPTTNYYYDVSGRLIGSDDALGHRNYRKLQNNTGYGGTEAVALKEVHADGGVVQYGLNVWGQVVTRTNELNKVTSYGYDLRGRLTSVTHAAVNGSSLVDTYGYDDLGQRISHYNSVQGPSVVEKTYYDVQGRVWKQFDYAGYLTQYNYAWDSALGSMGQTFGGLVKTTTAYVNTAVGSNGVTTTDKFDYFGRITLHTDYGSNSLSYTYDLGGRLSWQANAASNPTFSQEFHWFNTGKLSWTLSTTFTIRQATGFDTFINNQWVVLNAAYNYDRNGNRVSEALTRRVGSTAAAAAGASPVYLENALGTYDALNRLTHFTDSGRQGQHSADIGYAYDKGGNVRRVAATYTDQAGTTGVQQNYYYTYDSMDRIVITKGELNVNQIVIGATGTLLSYDAAGRRHDATSAAAGVTRVETYAYSDDDYLTGVTVTENGATKYTASTRRDLLGRTLEYSEQKIINGALAVSYHRYGYGGGANIYYNDNSLITDERVETWIDSQGSYSTTDTHYDYKDIATPPASWNPGSTTYAYDGQYMGGLVTHTRSINNQPQSSQYISETYNQYLWTDGPQRHRSYLYAAAHDTVPVSLTNTEEEYDWGWRLTSAHVGGSISNAKDVNFTNDMLGHVLSRSEYRNGGSSQHDYYYLNGIQVGDIDNSGATDIDYAGAINQRGVNPSPPSGQAADFDANYSPIGPSLSTTDASYTVREGETLQSIAAQLWGDASLWYLIAEANGLGASDSVVAGMRLNIPNKVVNVHHSASTFEVYDPSKAVGDLSPEALVPPPPKPKKKGGGCGGFGKIFSIVLSIVVNFIPVIGPAISAISKTIGGAFGALSGVVTAATSAALGSIVSQGIGVAIGIQDSFSWKSVALAAVSAGVAKGLTKVIPDASILKSTDVTNFVRGAAGNAITQGVAVATGLQPKFDWAGVAAGGVVAGVGGAVGRALHIDQLKPTSAKGITVAAVSGLAGGIAGAGVRSAITGTSFGDNVMAVLPDVIGQTIGNAIGAQIEAKFAEVNYRKAIRQADERLGQDPRYKDATTRHAAVEQLAGLKVLGVDRPNLDDVGRDALAAAATAQITPDLDPKIRRTAARNLLSTVAHMRDEDIDTVIRGYEESRVADEVSGRVYQVSYDDNDLDVNGIERERVVNRPADLGMIASGAGAKKFARFLRDHPEAEAGLVVYSVLTGPVSFAVTSAIEASPIGTYVKERATDAKEGVSSRFAQKGYQSDLSDDAGAGALVLVGIAALALSYKAGKLLLNALKKEGSGVARAEANAAAKKAFLSEADFLDLAPTGTINPHRIRFSQDSINSQFKNGAGEVQSLADGLKNGTINPASVPPIRIVVKEGKVYTLDNRRLWAFQQARVEVPYQKLSSIPPNETFKFTTKNDGVDIEVRKPK